MRYGSLLECKEGGISDISAYPAESAKKACLFNLRHHLLLFRLFPDRPLSTLVYVSEKPLLVALMPQPRFVLTSRLGFTDK